MAALIAGLLWRADSSANVAGGAFREARGLFPGRYSEIFGLGERLGCILNLGHSFDAIDVSLNLLVGRLR